MSRFAEFDARDVASRNKGVELEKLREAEKALQSLRAAGIGDKGFTLKPPFQRQSQTSVPVRQRRLSGQKQA